MQQTISLAIRVSVDNKMITSRQNIQFMIQFYNLVRQETDK